MPDAFADWSRREIAALDRLKSPAAIQAFLDQIPYNSEPITRPPRLALRKRRAHCFEGALIAAAAIRRLGHPPLLVDMRAVNDDDHVLCVFRERGHWGAVGKSNFVGLRFREPIYRTLRELAMSMFELYYNTLGEKTLRSCSAAVDLRRFDRLDWMGTFPGVAEVERRIESARHIPFLTPAMARALQPVDRRSREAGLHGANPAGLFRPKRG